MSHIDIIRRAVLALLLATTPALARQTGTIEGTARTAGTGAPLAEVQIVAEGTGRIAITDAHGHYRLTNLPAGELILIVERIGIETLRQQVVIHSGTTTRLDLELTEVPLPLGDIVVSIDREARRRAETAATITVLAGDAIRATRAAHPSELMGRIPGAWINVTGGEGHMTAIRQPQTTNPVYLYLEDGIPTRSTGFFNHNALYEVNLPQADRVEVVKGPATALYGSDAIGATINIGTRPPSETPTVDAALEAGAYGWARLLFSASGTTGGNGVRADLNLTRTDGWRDGSAYDRQSVNLRWDRALGGSTSLKTVAAFSRIDQETAGSSAISRDDYATNPTVNYTPISFREVRALRLSSELRHITARSLFTLTTFARDNDMEILPNWALTYDPTVYTTGHRSLGAMAKFRHDFTPLRTRLIVGVDLDHSPGHRFEELVSPTRVGGIFTEYAVGPTIYDYDATFQGFSPYLQAELSPLDRLRLTTGLRYDRLAYDYTSRLEPLATGSHRRPADTEVSYSHLSPKLGAAYEFGPALNLFLSYGHGFRAPSEGQLFRQGRAENTLALRPVRVDSYESGIRGQFSDAIRYELSAYQMVKVDDILSFTHPDGTQETVNAGRTLHRGIEAGLGIAPHPDLRLDLSYAYARHSYDLWEPRAGQDFNGNEMEQAPRVVGNAVLSYEPPFLEDGALALEASRIGPYWMDPANTTRYEGHYTLGLRARIPVYRGVALSARIANLTDTRYAELASYTTARGEELAPGMPRALYLGIQYR
jgi:outer membrane receptor protein involved in Fe transport